MRYLNKTTNFINVFIILIIFSYSHLLFAQKKTEKNNGENLAPAFALQNIQGKKVNLSDFKGKVVIIDFWATWCGPCKAEIPDFIDLYKSYKKKGLVILGIALDEKTKVAKFAKDQKINYPILFGTPEVSDLYGGISAIPTTYIINKKGVIIKRYVGQQQKEVFESDIKELL